MRFKTFVAKAYDTHHEDAVEGLSKYHRIARILSDTAVETYCGLTWTFSLYKPHHSDRPEPETVCKTCERKYAEQLSRQAKAEDLAPTQNLTLAQVLEKNPGAIEGIIRTSVPALDFGTDIELSYHFGPDTILIRVTRDREVHTDS
jgi:hypothetical protein